MTRPSIWRRLLVLPFLAAAPSHAAATDYLSIDEAQHVLLPNANHFVRYSVTLTDVQRKRIRAIAGTPQRTATPSVWKALRDGKQTGWMIVDEVIGKHEFITYATAISMDGHVTGVEILSYRESKGGQVRNARWRALFKGKTLRDQFKLNKDIPNISGATLSCRNITDGVKRLLAVHAVALANAN